MKKIISIPVLVAAAIYLLLSCNSKQTADQYLEDDAARKELMIAITHHQPYMDEMMNAMMNSDSSQNLMAKSMMGQSGMMGMMMDHMMNMCKMDSTACREMFNKTMDMCNADEHMRGMMMHSMQSRPNVMKSMQAMCDRYAMIMEEANKEHHEHVHK